MPAILSKPVVNKYANGKIYKLENEFDEFDSLYVGSTCKSLPARKSGHNKYAKQEPDRPVYEYFNYWGWDGVRIVLLENFPCQNKQELEVREQFWIDKLKPDLNSKNAHNTKEANQAQYRKDSAKDRIRNADRIKQSKALRIHCDCGVTGRRDDYKRHCRTKFHQEYLKTQI